MAQWTKGVRDWEIINKGEGDLILTGAEPSCSCTVLNLKPGTSHTLKPGETYPVKVEWETRGNKGSYEKSAKIYTNDPEHPELLFVVKGEVQPAVVMVPENGVIDAMGVSNDKSHEFHVAIGSPDRPEMKLTSLTVSRPDLLDVSSRPMTKEEMGSVNMNNGHLVTVTVKPSKRLGTFREGVVIKTDHPLKEEIQLTVNGKIIGPVSVIPEKIRMLGVPGAKGASETVTLWVRGQNQTEFTVAEKPENLKVAIAPADDSSETSDEVKGRAYHLTATVEPGTEPGVLSKPIVLKTDHPFAETVEVPLYIQVLGGN